MPVLNEWRVIAEKYLHKPHLGNIKQGYLELMGEGNPQSSGLPEIKVVGDTGAYTWSTPNAHIYEYLWTLSLTSEPGIKRRSREKLTSKQGWVYRLRKKLFSKRGWTHMLRKRDAILIQLIFYTYDTPYLVRVLTTTLKPPFMIKKTMIDRLKEILKVTEPVRNLAKNVVSNELGTLMDAIGMLEKDSVPNYNAYPWYSKTFTALVDDKPKGAEGVEFRIDRKAFMNLGNRLMGSVGIMFICKSQDIKQKHPPIKLEARARMSFEGSPPEKRESWIPEKMSSRKDAYFNDCLFLEINPKPIKASIDL